jgi:hypothetical protein
MMVSRLRRGLEKMTKNDDMEAVLQELAEEAMITGGAVWTFGPDGSEQLFPPARRSWSRR